MPQINASFPKDVIEQVNDKWKTDYPHVRSFSEMVLTLVKVGLTSSETKTKKSK